MASITYQASKTASKFHLDDSFVRLQFGAVRCGKTASSVNEIRRRAWEQYAAPDGIRYTRWAIFRNTYPELKMTTIKTWLDWFPENIFGKLKWDSPISHLIEVDNVRCEVFFVSIDRPDDISKLLSMELTGAYFNEVQFTPEIIFDAALKRVYNYPPKKMGVPIKWGGVIADTNPPDSDHWIFKRFETNCPTNHRIFKYEPAVIKVDANYDGEHESAVSIDGTRYIQNPDADYIKHLQKKDYYLNGVQSSTDDDIAIYFRGEYGTLRKNKRVYPEYNDSLHCVDGLRYSPTIELGIGIDFGRTPAMVMVQMMPWGSLDLIDELTSEDCGVSEFIEVYAIPYLNRNFHGWKDNYVVIGDPAGRIRNEENKTCFSIMASHGLVNCQSAKTNNFVTRREAVSYFLRVLRGGKPGFRISSKCVTARKGFLGDYYYPRQKIITDERYKEEPDKNYASHPHDALQYIALHYRGDFDTSQKRNDVSLIGNTIY